MSFKFQRTWAYLVAASLLASAQASPVRAEAGDGNDLLKVCDPDSGMFSLCVGQVTAYVRAFAFAQAAGMGPVYCMPEKATVGQAIDVLVQFLRANPGKRHAEGEIIFLAALSNTWPCANGPATLLDNGGIILPKK